MLAPRAASIQKLNNIADLFGAKPFYTHQQMLEMSGARDGARTRDLRRDRPTL